MENTNSFQYQYFIKPNELLAIRRALLAKNRVILAGSWVNGNTSILEILASQLKQHYHSVKVLSCQTLDNVLELEYVVDHLYGTSLLCLDNYNYLLSGKLNESLLKLMRSYYKGLNVVMTVSDRSYVKNFDLICPILNIHAFAEQVVTPSITEKSILYHSPLLYTSSKEKTIITTEEKKLITDIKTIERNMLALINKNPNEIHTLSPREFEEFVAQLYRAQGFEVALMKATRDGGKDFVISNKTILGDQLIYGQCKKNAIQRAVGIAVIRELYATITLDKATSGIIVTSSSFSKDAIKFAKQMPHQMSLVDFERLKIMIQSIS